MCSMKISGHYDYFIQNYNKKIIENNRNNFIGFSHFKETTREIKKYTSDCTN